MLKFCFVFFFLKSNRPFKNYFLTEVKPNERTVSVSAPMLVIFIFFSYKQAYLTGIKCIICIDICKTNKSGSSLSMKFSGGKINHVNVFSISIFSKTRRLILSG